jgi:tRNA threonylcarbamoyl adenosine modification protein (Sua5/YciO/YrdC/YwlC family)
MAKIIPVVVKETSSLESKVKQHSFDAIKEAVDVINSGGIIAVPTDTLYGLACNAADKNAVDKLFDIKKRSHSNPLAICVADVEDVSKWCKVTIPKNAMDKLLPGQVSLVFERHNNILPHLNPGVGSLAVRVPDCDFLRQVCRQTGSALALTSANISATQSSLRIEEFSDLWSEVDRVFDGGDLSVYDPNREGSTVLVLTKVNKYRIRRKGCASSLVQKVMELYNITPDQDQ